MLKPWHSALTQHYGRSTTTLALFWHVLRSDAQVYGWVEHDRALTIDGVTYRAAAGLRASAAQTTVDMQPGTLDVSAFLDVSTEADLEAGVWDEAQVTIFEARWDALPTALDATQCNILLSGRLGNIDRQTGVFQAQLHGLLEQLDTRVGRMYSATCPWRLGDSRCQVDLAPWTRTGTVTHGSIDGRYMFEDSAQSEPEGFFNEGVLTFTSGAHTGRSVDIRRWEPPTFSFHRPLPFPVLIGDAYRAVRGDDKRLITCSGVFGNQERFGGFPLLPGIDAVMRNPLTRPLT